MATKKVLKTRQSPTFLSSSRTWRPKKNCIHTTIVSIIPRGTTIKYKLYSRCPTKKCEAFRRNNSEMPRMSSSLKFERYPTGNRHSFDIPNRIHSPRGKEVTSQRASCSISRTSPSCVHVCVPHTRPANAHVHATEARPGSPDASFQHAALRPACRCCTIGDIWVIRKRLQGSCRGNFSFRFFEKSCGQDESER